MPLRVLPRLVFLIALVWVSPAHADDFTGKLVGVTDGDTITRGRTPIKDPPARHPRSGSGLVLDVARRPVEGDARAYHVFHLVGGQTVPPGDRGGLGVDAVPFTRR